MSKNTGIALICIAVIIVLGGGFWLFSKKPAQQAPAVQNQQQEKKQFLGQIKSIQGNIITATGQFISNPGLIKLQIKVNQNTQYNKTTITRPEIKPTKQPIAWDPNTINSKTTAGSLDDLRLYSNKVNGLIIVANIIQTNNENMAVATSVNYTEEVILK
jgi:hypothetical protein